jgi:exoribonuclease R
MSLLTGHAAGVRMLKGGLGLLRTMPAPDEERLKAFRHAARTLKFNWPQEMGYNDFIRSLPLDHPCLLPLVWQAKRVTGGADYVAFDGTPPADPLHHALAMEYAHVTAPLRRLADRYVLDLLVELEKGTKPSDEARATLAKLPKVMNEAETREGRMERRGVDVAEAWTLQLAHRRDASPHGAGRARRQGGGADRAAPRPRGSASPGKRPVPQPGRVHPRAPGIRLRRRREARLRAGDLM